MFNFEYKKSLGQNFLKDDNIIKKIIANAGIDKETLVLEIGPGSGALTKYLAPISKQVICYEIDKRLEQILNKNLGEYDNVEIIFEDFLRANITDIISKYNYKKLYVVANLPYYITTPIINKLTTDNINLNVIIIMIQKEVAERLSAVPSTKEYNSLTVYLNYHYHITKLFDVSKKSFIPKPKVDSSVIKLEKKAEKLLVVNENHFYKLIKDSFKFKRKNIKNNLTNYNLEIIEKVLKKYNLDLTSRSEMISLEAFVELSNNLVQN